MDKIYIYNLAMDELFRRADKQEEKLRVEPKNIIAKTRLDFVTAQLLELNTMIENEEKLLFG
ncbi:MAG: hypothetical protein WCO84_00940 [bacterium]